MNRRSAIVMAIVGWSSLAFSAELVRLKVTELAGVDRISEPIVNGVPFPQGAVSDVNKLALVGPDGRPVPAAFTATCLWPKDKSVRWALLDTQVTVPAKGSAGYGVVTGTAAKPKRAINVVDGGDVITVNTGVLKFTVRKKGFRVFESAWLDESGAGKFDRAHQLLAEPTEGLAMSVHGQRYTSAGDQSSTVVIEEKNAMRVALLATGRLAGGGGEGYHYEVRIHAYAGSPFVKVVPTVIKKFGKRRQNDQGFQDLSLGLKTAATTGLTYTLGREAAPAVGKLTAGKMAHVLAKTSDQWVFGGEATGSGKCKSTKPLTLGWGDLSGPNGGVAVGVYRFWQIFPKAIEVSGDGLINVGLYPKLMGVEQEFYTGMARTHEVLVAFHGKNSRPADLQKRFVGLQKPLFALAPATWYCQKTLAFGPLAAVGSKLDPAVASAVDSTDKRIMDCFNQLMTQRQDNYHRNDVQMDAYGFLAYGDTIHYTWDNEPLGSKWKIVWDSNYYDMPHLAALTWARTGDPRILEFFADHSWHLMDVDIIFWDDAPGAARGGSRRCPATNHVGFDPPHQREPVHNNAFDHHKTESLFERYYLLGDRRALYAANELLWWANNTPRDGQAGNRTGAHQTMTLMAGYAATGDSKYLQHARKVIASNMARQAANNGGFNQNLQFADGIIAESMAKYYLATGDEEVFKAIQRFCDWNIAGHNTGHAASNCAFANALVYSKTKDDKYLKSACDFLGKGSTGNIGKDMAMSYRSINYVSALLSKK